MVRTIILPDGEQIAFIITDNQNDADVFLGITNYSTGMKLKTELLRQGIKCVVMFTGGIGWSLKVSRADYSKIENLM